MLFFGLLSLVSTASLKRINYSNSTSCSHHNIEDPITLIPDAGLYAFNFGRGNAGNIAPQRYLIDTLGNENPLGLIIFDCYCGGDRFVAYDYVSDYNILFANARCDLATPKCQGYLGSPQECALYAWNQLDFNRWSSQIFCSGNTWIYSPSQQIGVEIAVASTLFGGGTAFIWLFSVANPDDFFYYGGRPVPTCFDETLPNPLEKCYLEVVTCPQ